VASLLTLVLLPTLYVTWYGGKAIRPEGSGGALQER
jgi:hypothetical protein